MDLTNINEHPLLLLSWLDPCYTVYINKLVRSVCLTSRAKSFWNGRLHSKTLEPGWSWSPHVTSVNCCCLKNLYINEELIYSITHVVSTSSKFTTNNEKAVFPTKLHSMFSPCHPVTCPLIVKKLPKISHLRLASTYDLSNTFQEQNQADRKNKMNSSYEQTNIVRTNKPTLHEQKGKPLYGIENLNTNKYGVFSRTLALYNSCRKNKE